MNETSRNVFITVYAITQLITTDANNWAWFVFILTGILMLVIAIDIDITNQFQLNGRWWTWESQLLHSWRLLQSVKCSLCLCICDYHLPHLVGNSWCESIKTPAGDPTLINKKNKWVSIYCSCSTEPLISFILKITSATAPLHLWLQISLVKKKNV